MIVKKTENSILLADMIERSSRPVYIILDGRKIELTESHNLINLFRKYWKMEDVTEVILETEDPDFYR